jgi:hypothetical protein
MLEIATAIATFLILLFSGLTFWDQVLRTPSSDVGVDVLEREEPYSTSAANVLFRAPAIQVFNRGEMEAIITDAEGTGELIDIETGESFSPPGEGTFEVSFGSSIQQKRVAPGSNLQIKPGIDLNNLNEFPQEFLIQTSHQFDIQDNTQSYSLCTSDRFRFVHERG